ncbi:MAG TPA: DEAD/DEAH box helicase, partial [Thermoanaerobaculia bacterium]|nr:DEAD/DEAH box helicase [Thermoanaerobaculia bacterium]
VDPPPPAAPPPAAVSPLADLVASLRDDPRLGDELVHVLRLPAAPARHGRLEPPLPPPLAAALAASGADPLWRHQVEAIAAARAGEDVLLTTPTASGKSLVFQVPLLEEALAGRPGRALWLFPLKALGQDQKAKLDYLAALCGLVQDGGGATGTPLAAIYDGDTPRAEREAIRRDPPRVLITNPDMLHMGLLAHWPAWGAFLVDLRWIVLDELHVYRGIFGSHFHHVLQRLLRICRELGASPSFVASSATAANAGELAADLAGRPFRQIAESGAPREGRHLLLFRPQASPYTTALDLFALFLRAGLKTIAFTKARRITELLGSWLAAREPELARRVATYRSGFLPEERRRIEADLFAGRLHGVISTSALEMGIDVGGLDACILVGYPGSVMATWQRSGRVGRAGRESLTALVALPDALDQWYLDHPAELVGRPCERLVVDPANPPVSRAHLVCAAAESPLRRPGDAGYLDRHAREVETLLAANELLEGADGGELFARARRPHSAAQLRGTGATWAIVDVEAAGGRGRTVGTLDGVRAFREGHPGAVYLHAGRQYLVDELDPARHRVLARRAEIDWYTMPLAEKETAILEVLDARRSGPLQAWLGRVRVTERVVGYERKRLQSRETLSRHELDLPPVSFETVALWWAAPRAIEATLARRGEGFMGALHAAEHATIALLPRLALCDRGDLGGISIPRHPQLGTGAVFVYDGHAGGVGIAAAGFAALESLLGDVAAHLAACPCDAGCPSCVQSPKCGNGNRPLDKAGAVRLLRLLLGAEEPAEAWGAAVEVRIELAEEEVATGTEGGRGEWDRGLENESRRRDRLEGEGQPGAVPADLLRRADGVRLLAGGGEAALDRPAKRARSGLWERIAAALRRRAGRIASCTRRSGSPPPLPADDAKPRAPSVDAPAGPAAVSMAAPPLAEGLGASAVPAGSVTLPSTGIPLVEPFAGAPEVAGPLLSFDPAASRSPSSGTLLFDLETLRSAAEVGGWGNAHRMGVALAVVCHLEEGRFETFGEDRVGDLVALLAVARRVIGFNVERFDYRVLAGYTGIDYAARFPTLDLLADLHRRIGFRVGMGHLAEATLGVGKSADGLQSLAWVREGRLDLVESYCRRDVELLRDLYLHGRREGWICYRDRRRGERLRVRVEW